ncbi:MAG TPA: 23S rRNA (guanosine(2251)-2'-O)-methyltransferase RlmB [Steroidobacteraceae bacterium]|nr:23S rRNA (guanosine(2251)-2'-O)-methyltransferase RlmB [Steroidobacteraceae bacterium]
MADSKRNYVYGVHAVNAALERAPERVLELWVAQPRDGPGRIQELKQRAERAGVHVHRVSPDAVSKLVGDVVHQGAVAAMRPLKSWDEHDLADLLDQLAGDALLLILDGVTDPHNLGACLRSADAAGAHAVIIPKDRAATLDGVARKVAAGAAEFIPVASVTNLVRTLGLLKQRGIWIVGADGEAEETLYTVDFKRPIALVLGAEGTGMRRLTRETCDFLVRIPMLGHVQSLNVSVAAGIGLFEVLRQRAG